ncbi:MAG: PD-(D/E)XK nuclease family protein, partial [Paludibacteraceae bacterium]|nr:PD-(D/E)XK nuclease family protein [Paludibacteraceae bacterium]
SNLRVLRNMIRRKLELVTIPFHGEPITDIQVIGVLETRLLDFDHILILNAEEGVIPQQSNENSYLPYDLRREYGMATREEENRIYAYNFFRLFRRAKDVTLTFSDSFTDTGKHTMSRFVMQMLCADKHNQIQRYRLTESEQLEPFAIPPTYWCKTDVAPSALSPSGISEYITCPRWFYLDKIRHTDSSDTTPIVLEQNTLGDLLHSTMKNAYLDICGIPLSDSRELDRPYEITADAIDKYLKDAHRLSDALDIAYREENDNYQKHHTMGADEPLPYIRADHEVENHIVLTMARKILSQDKAMSPFTLVWMEHPVSATIGGMHIHGIIDRMDIIQREGQQRLRILDYKTGGFDEKKISFQIDELIKDPVKRYALQTLIYSELSNNSRPDAGRDLPIMPELLFTRKMSADGRLQISPADKGGEPMYIMDYMADCRKDFLPKLEEVFRQILDNMQPGKEFVMQEDIKQCADSYCPFHQLCGRKKKEWK